MFRHHVRHGISIALVGCLLTDWVGSTSAAVVVLINRSSQIVELTLQSQGAAAAKRALRPRDQLSWPTLGTVSLQYVDEATPKQYQLDPNSVYYFGDVGRGVELQQIGLGRSGTAPQLDPAAERSKYTAPMLSVPVKILVDDNEVQNEATWKRRARARVATASAIFEDHCRVRLEVVEEATWNSDNAINDFNQSLAEFESKVSPGAAWLAIGFTSQYANPQGSTKLGGTRGPFHPWLLMREWPQHVSERERLEVLVHEIGHVLGSAHSPEQDSVMRPVLGDRIARLKEFRIVFDPLNTLAMYLIAEEMRLGRVRNMNGLSTATRLRLADVYEALNKGLPQDPAAPVYLQMALPPGGRVDVNGPGSVQKPAAVSVKLVYDAVWQAGERNALLPKAEPGASSGGLARYEGDALLDYYFREAALAAKLLPENQAASAMATALAIALVDPGTIERIPPLAVVARKIGEPARRGKKAEVIGVPTVQGRADWAQHFVISSALSVVLGPQLADAAGLTKELSDAGPKGSGFSLADYAADLAGIVFAQRLIAAPFVLEQFESRFKLNDYLPELKNLDEGLSLTQFQTQFGGAADSRFQQRRIELFREAASQKGYSWWAEAEIKRRVPRGTLPPLDRG